MTADSQEGGIGETEARLRRAKAVLALCQESKSRVKKCLVENMEEDTSRDVLSHEGEAART